ncbi:serine hydrolase domain-containing protein [Allonocardiopsis opalescens]|uniref:CubicO group peptidase (Beta-lactamase class C family) n=1 Tax=Allonocardiopsis opalescens TaxID=1144618 RepID=A0A2T0Q4G3_9ACTN|nr:serine hydrolase domain-containing protein [Allonocardiopsis opalescens]PRX98670.1 CubicO group peptidase (beta-lactamase class C family) [Allonocardiopsis opalescens]
MRAERDAEREPAELCELELPAGPSGAVLRVASSAADLATVVRGHRWAFLLEDGVPRPVPDPPPMVPDAVFDLASVTKAAATTGAVMSLVDGGALDLDAPAADWLPALPPAVRLRDLLEHRSGLPEWWPVYLLDGVCGRDPLEAVAELPPRHPVGQGRHYSDLGFMLLGGIVARASGLDLPAAARRLAFEPAGMAGAHFRPRGTPADAALPLVATAHGDAYERRSIRRGEPHPVQADTDSFAGWREHTLVGEVHDGNAWHAFDGVAGHAGLFGTADDLVAFGRALLASLRGTGPWTPRTTQHFLTPARSPDQALGFAHWPEQHAFGHSGFTGIRFAVLPEHDRVVALLTNRVHAPGLDFPDLAPLWSAILSGVRAGC